MNPVDRIEQAIGQMHLTTRARTDGRILDGAYAALERATQGQAAVSQRVIHRITFTSPIVVFGAVAAVIGIVASVALMLWSRSGLDIRRLSEALVKVENICTATCLPGQAEPSQQQWASRSLSINMLKLGDKYLMSDLSAGIIKTKASASSSTVTDALPENLMAVAEEKMALAFGLVPSVIAENPLAENVTWRRVDRSGIEAASAGTEVYDLTWTDQDGGTQVHRWRYFVDGRTSLPSKIEFYTREFSSPGYSLSRYVLVSYPTQEEVQTLAVSVFGAENQGQRPASGYPEYMSTPGSYRRNGL